MIWFLSQENNKKKADSKEASVVPNLPPPKVQKVDLAALFTARQLPMSDQECVSRLNPSRPVPGRKEKINLNFYFHTSFVVTQNVL